MADVDRAFTALLEDVAVRGIGTDPETVAARASARRSRRFAAAVTAGVVLAGGAVYGLPTADRAVQPAPADHSTGPLSADSYDEALLALDELPEGPDGSWAPWQKSQAVIDHEPFGNPCMVGIPRRTERGPDTGGTFEGAGARGGNGVRPHPAPWAFAIQDVARWSTDNEARQAVRTVHTRCQELGLRTYSLGSADDAAFGFVVAGPSDDGDGGGSRVAAIGVVGSDIVGLSLSVSTDPAEVPMDDVADSLATALERLGAPAPMLGEHVQTGR